MKMLSTLLEQLSAVFLKPLSALVDVSHLTGYTRCLSRMTMCVCVVLLFGKCTLHVPRVLTKRLFEATAFQALLVVAPPAVVWA